MAIEDTTVTGGGDIAVEPIISKRELGFVMVALFTSLLLAALDSTIFSTTLPTIVGELNGVDQMLWVTTAYILAATITMPVYGKLGDLLGHKSLLLVTLVLFLGGSVLGGLAGSMPVLIAARGVQGLGGGGLMILGLAIWVRSSVGGSPIRWVGGGPSGSTCRSAPSP
jgi:MFS family permease